MSYNKSLKEKFDKEYQRGEDGLNVGLPFPLTQLSDSLCNLQQGTYYLIAGAQGTGKSTLANECFISYPIQYLDVKKDSPFKVHIEYFNLEIKDVDVLAKFKCNWIFRQTKGKIMLSLNKVFQKGNFRLNQEERDWIKKSDEYIEYLLDSCNFVAGERISKNFVYKKLWECATKFGTMEPYLDGNNNPVPNRYYLHTYKPKDPNQFVIFLFDNLNNLSNKADIDEISQYFVDFRNACNFTFCVVQQYNRGQESMDRRDFMIPQLSDLMESSKPSADCNVALLTYAPARFKLMEYEGYNLMEKASEKQTLGSFLRFLRVAKNRDGRDDIYVPYMFSGARGFVKEMPEPVTWFKNENNLKQTYYNLFV